MDAGSLAAFMAMGGYGAYVWPAFVLTAAVMAAGKLWASSNDGRIASVDAVTGALGAATEIGFSGAIAPILSSGKMMVLAGDGTLIAVN